MVYTINKVIKPSDVYGNFFGASSQIQRVVNDSHNRITEFRPPLIGEFYLTTAVTFDKAEHNWPETDPRFIVLAPHTFAPSGWWE